MTTHFKKLSVITLSLTVLSGIVFSVGSQNPNIKFEAEAALVNTNRVWMKNSIWEDWDSYGAATCIHYWDEDHVTDWPGVNVAWDGNNEKIYYDLPTTVTGFMYTRGNSTCTDYWDGKTAEFAVSGNINTRYFDMNGGFVRDTIELATGTWYDFTASTTWAVANYAGTIDTAAKACSQSAAQAAVNAYNNLSTFEQNQFNALSVGGGFTGAQRLAYLINFYNITTPLNTSDNLSFGIMGTSGQQIAIISSLSLVTMLVTWLYRRFRVRKTSL
jgi:hypothetical protein